ncbi:hypothetical protein D047_0779B, partial [Vibrio parahaemolyticus VPTS-2010_2]
CPKSQLESVEF